MNDPLPPHSAEAEQAVLGSILIDPYAIERIVPLLKPDDFYQECHGKIYRVMLILNQNGTPPDWLAVQDLLERRGDLEDVGGPAYLTALINATPTSVHAEHYAGQVERYSERRQVIHAAADVTAQAYDTNSGDPVAFALERITAIEKQRPVVKVNGSTWRDLDGVISPIEWLWLNWLSKAFLAIILAAQAMGKSILALRIAACFLRGDPWPDGTPFGGEVGKIVWAEAEASQAMNLERANRWGLPIENILHPLDDPLEDVQLNNSRHRTAIAALAHRSDVQAVIVDSLSGGHTLSENSSSEMILTVKWLAELARDSGKSVILTHHARKRSILDVGEEMTLDRSRGSSGITQTARMVWGIDAPDPSKPDNRRLSVIKSNLAPKPEALGFTVNGAGIVFGDAPEPHKKKGKLEEATEFLRETLANGRMETTALKARAEDAGISEPTLKRARDELRIQADKDGDKWYCSLPTGEGA